MINKKFVAFVWAILNLVLLGCAYELTGTWRGDDGGTYYIRQIGNDICWFGELTPQNPGWANVAYGTISGNIINLKWADVPKSGARGSGTLSLSVINDATLRAQAVTGGFGGSTWTKSTTPTSGAASIDPLDYFASGAFCRDHPTEPVCYCRIHPEDPTCPRRQLFH